MEQNKQTSSLSFSPTHLAILLLITQKPRPRENLILCPSAAPWTLQLHCDHFHRRLLPLLCPSAAPWTLQLHCDHFHRRLLPLWPRPIWCCSRLSKKISHFWCSRTDRWLCPLSFGHWRCRCPSGLQKILILLLAVLLSWPYALVHGLEWCHSHLKACHFQSALALLFTAPEFLQPKSFWNI